MVSQLAAFYGSRDDVTEWPSYARAEQATELFRSHYFHALPFHRSVLGAMWQRCRGARDQCRAGAARVQLDLGNLRVRLLADASDGAGGANGEAPAPDLMQMNDPPACGSGASGPRWHVFEEARPRLRHPSSPARGAARRAGAAPAAGAR